MNTRGKMKNIQLGTPSSAANGSAGVEGIEAFSVKLALVVFEGSNTLWVLDMEVKGIKAYLPLDLLKEILIRCKIGS